MIMRAVATAVMLLLAVCALFDNALGAGHFLNPFGILFLLLAGLVWFAWNPIREGFLSAKDESDLPIIRMASKTLAGMAGLSRPPRRRSSPSS